MSTINEHNLDEMLFDYLEGNLSPTEAAELEAFLKAHPEHAAELEAWKATYVKPGAKVPVYAGAEGLVQSTAGGWLGGLKLLGLGSLAVVVVVAVVVLMAPQTPTQLESPPLLAEAESERIEVVEEPEPLVTAMEGDTVVFQPDIEAINRELVALFSQPHLPGRGGEMLAREPFGNLPFANLGVTNSTISVVDTIPSNPADSLEAKVESADTMAALVDSVPRVDSSETVVSQAHDFSTQRSTPSGNKAKKKRKKAAKRSPKPVRVVPLKSDAF